MPQMLNAEASLGVTESEAAKIFTPNTKVYKKWKWVCHGDYPEFPKGTLRPQITLWNKAELEAFIKALGKGKITLVTASDTTITDGKLAVENSY